MFQCPRKYEFQVDNLFDIGITLVVCPTHYILKVVCRGSPSLPLVVLLLSSRWSPLAQDWDWQKL